MVSGVYYVVVYGSATAVVVWLLTTYYRWLLDSAVATFNSLFVGGVGSHGKAGHEQRAEGVGWNALRPPLTYVPYPEPALAVIVTVANSILLPVLTAVFLTYEFEKPIPRTWKAFVDVQGQFSFILLFRGIPAGVLLMAASLSSALPTTVYRGFVVAILYHLFAVVTVVLTMLFLALLQVPFAVSLVKAYSW